MNDKQWERYAALGGVVFVVANVIGAIVAGSPPAPDATAAKITEWFTDHDSGIMASQVCAGIGSIGLLWWAGTLWRRMSKVEERPRLAIVSMLGLAIAGALFLTSNGVNTAVAIRIDAVGDGSQIFYVLSGVLLAAAGFFVAAHVGATSVLGLRTKMLPVWLGALGVLDTVAFVVAGIIGSTSDSSAAMVVGFISFIAWMVWILGVSVTMWRATEPAMT